MTDNNQVTLTKRDDALNPRQIRSTGNIPVTVYGASMEQSLALQIDEKTFVKAKSSKFIHSLSAKIDGLDGEHVLVIKDIDKHPVSNQILNLQLQRLAGDETATVEVPLTYTGVSPLVQAGGSLFINKKHLRLECSSTSIPSHVEYDIANLKDDKTYACYSDLALPAGVELKEDAKQIIAKVSSVSDLPEEEATATEGADTPAAEGESTEEAKA